MPKAWAPQLGHLDGTKKKFSNNVFEHFSLLTDGVFVACLLRLGAPTHL
jgi:hypothetical protein